MRIKLFLILFITLPFFNFKKNNEIERIGLWHIKKGVLIKTKSSSTYLAKENWNVFYSIFPKKIINKYITQIELISDGKDQKTGALESLSEKNDQWKLIIDPVDVNFKTVKIDFLYQSIYTFIHEFGHLLTLNNTQINKTKKNIKLTNILYNTFEGVSYNNSYINLFIKKFWNNQLLNKWDKIQKDYCYLEQESEICNEKLFGLYNDNYDNFLTDYSAESPEEDIAESWTAFILKNKIKKPQSIAEQKINFFYQFPKLIKYRKIIRNNIKKYLF